MKKIVAMLLAATMSLTCLVGCGGSGTEGDSKNPQQNVGGDSQGGDSQGGGSELDMSETVKIGILVADATGAEALAFRAYYEKYIQAQYNVELMYSDELKDAAQEASAIDNFIASGCKGIISFASADRPAQITQCSNAGVYYAVATGTLGEQDYETFKSNEYYVGAIGPSVDVEFQAGYDMAKHFIDEGMNNFAIFGGTTAYGDPMHTYRAAGMVSAMVDASGADYQGMSTKEDIVDKLTHDHAVVPCSIGDYTISGYIGGFDMDDAWFGQIAGIMNTPGLQAFLAVGVSDLFAGMLPGDSVALGSVDAYASNYGDLMKGGQLDYMAGKFSASIGPIFIALYRAVLGSPVRTEDGSAIALEQGYWTAASAADFDTYYAVDSSTEAPAYTKEMLDTLLTASYADFEKFVKAYSFDEIQALAK